MPASSSFSVAQGQHGGMCTRWRLILILQALPWTVGGKGRFLGNQSKVSCIDYCALPSAQGPDQLLAQISFGPRPALTFLTAESQIRAYPWRYQKTPACMVPRDLCRPSLSMSTYLTQRLTIDGRAHHFSIYHWLLMRALEFQTLGCVICMPLPPLKRLQGEQLCGPANFITSFPRFR